MPASHKAKTSGGKGGAARKKPSGPRFGKRGAVLDASSVQLKEPRPSRHFPGPTCCVAFTPITPRSARSISAAMDPVSITAGAVGLAAHALRAAMFVKNTLHEMQDAPVFTRDIAEDIIVVQGSLREVELALSRNPLAIRSFGLDDIFDVSVGTCRDTLERISDEFESLFGRDDWGGRFAVWWSTGEIRRLLDALETKKGSLTLLVQALSLRSMQEIHDLLERNQATLDLAHLGLGGMVSSYPAYTAMGLDAMPSEIGSVDGIFGDRESVLSDTNFAFDSLCIGSKAYHRTVARVLNEGVPEAAAPPDGPALPAIEEDEAEAEEAEAEASGAESEGEASIGTAVPPAFVSIEEHEAVCARLREAEIRIQILQELLVRDATLRLMQESGDQDTSVDTDRILPKDPGGKADEGTKPRPVPPDGSKPKSPWFPRKISRWSETSVSQSTLRTTSSAAPKKAAPSAALKNPVSGQETIKPEEAIGPSEPTSEVKGEAADKTSTSKSNGKRPTGPRAQRIRPKEGVVETEGTKRPTDPTEASSRGGPPDAPNTGNGPTSSQTSLLIEWFEGTTPPVADASKPSVRVKLTPASTKKSREFRFTQTANVPLDNSSPPAPAHPPDSKQRTPRPVTVEEAEEEKKDGALPLATVTSSVHASSVLKPPEAGTKKASPSEVSAPLPDSLLDGLRGPPTAQKSSEKATKRRSKASKTAEPSKRRESRKTQTAPAAEDAPKGLASVSEERKSQLLAQVEEAVKRIIQSEMKAAARRKRKEERAKNVEGNGSLPQEKSQQPEVPTANDTAALKTASVDTAVDPALSDKHARRQRRAERRRMRNAEAISDDDEGYVLSPLPRPLPSIFKIVPLDSGSTTQKAGVTAAAATLDPAEDKRFQGQRRAERRRPRTPEPVSENKGHESRPLPDPMPPLMSELHPRGLGRKTRAASALDNDEQPETGAETSKDGGSTGGTNQPGQASVQLPALSGAASRYLQRVDDERAAKDKVSFANLLRNVKNVRASFEDMDAVLDSAGPMNTQSIDSAGNA